MSLLQYPETVNVTDLQIWNNAAFDSGDPDETAAIKASCCPLQPIFFNLSESMESDSSKENQSHSICKSPVSVKSPVSIKPLQPNGAIEISQGKPLKLLLKQGIPLPSPTVSKTGNEAPRDDRKIDTEIEEIEMEINRLSSKLEALRLEKAERNLMTIEKRGKIVPSKFMGRKQSSKIEEPPATSTNPKFRSRGISLGPSEIIAGVKSRRTSTIEITPIQSIQNRRKSCYWKLQEIDEEKLTKQRGRSLSPRERNRLSVAKIQASKQGFTTVGSKKSVKRDDGIMSCIQPKKLFKEGEKSVAPKKPFKPGRVVASRYNQTPVQSVQRKRSFPENEEESKRWDNKRASVGKTNQSETGRNQVNENRVKKQWEISSVAVMGQKSSLDGGFLPSTLDLLPKIRTVRRNNETPRDSGPTKRVAELIERRKYFSAEETEEDISVCQALHFDDEEIETNAK